MKSCSIIVMSFIAVVLLLNSCSPFTTTLPDGFASYGGILKKRSVSPNQVVFRVRQVKNKPYAGFDFWREALPKRMRDAGYRIVSDSVVTVKDRKALILEMITPLGSYDYSYIVMMSIRKKKILIAEAAGTVDEFRKQRKKVFAALYTTSFK